jgi:hypothetical protein
MKEGSMAPTTVTLSDIEGLADRLLARAKSRLFNDQPDLKSDLLLAGNLLRRWLWRGTDLGCPFALDD